MVYNNKTFFISHSSIDSRLHDCFCDLLTNGFSINKNAVFSSSISRNIATNDAATETIKVNIQNCDVIFLLITSSFMRSPFCLAELGAAWALDKHIVPILFEPVSLIEYDKTPLKGRQFVNIHKLGTVYSELNEMGYIAYPNFDEFNKHYNIFKETLKYAEKSGNKYIATITQDRAEMNCRSNLQGKRCLKLDSLIPLGDSLIDGETHWLFFDDDKEKFGNPQIGDVVEFIVSGDRYNENTWGDGLDKTRNIYTNKKIIIKNR